ncbi:serine-rich adhesin for platelets-like [Cherax quadricarinatus]|uniref:serine-rich adhesin for platelets-like n=1 Tax=Cherax quadricarinatus TaxID=27406 RepID=UPI00387EE5CD
MISRHVVHQRNLDLDTELLHGHGRGRGRGLEKARVIREGVLRWTFPARTPTRPPASSRNWHPQHSWSTQFQNVPDYSVPEMEGVVSEELRQRIQRVLTFPMGRTQGEESTTDTTPTTAHDNRTPAGGLLQDYLDQLEPEGEDDELMFQGSESEESDADLLYDPEKESYTTPYLLYLQQARARKEPPILHSKILEDDLIEDETEMADRATEGREGAMGRFGYRYSVPDTLTNSKEPPTSASNSKEPPTSASNSKEHPTSASNSKEPPTSASNSKEPPTSASTSKEPPTSASTSREPPTSASSSKEPPTLASHDAYQQDSKVHFRRASRDLSDESNKNGTGYHRESLKHVGISGEMEEELLQEKDEDGIVSDHNQKKKKKKRRKKGSHGRVTSEESEEEIHKTKLEELKKSIALQLFRDFAKNVFAKEHPEFQLFESFEETDKSKDSDVSKAVQDS